ncbi:hypothetical protein G6F42_008875 [Rhizopus arrhizus]|nr:hypothetical protein G6F42_008875 [Rhizopus arrhizus]
MQTILSKGKPPANNDNNDKGLYDVAPSTYANKGCNNQEKKASKAAQKKKDKQSMKRSACGGTDHARSSSFKYLYYFKSKAEAH